MTNEAEKIVVTQDDRDAAKAAWEAACLSDLYYTPVKDVDPNETPEGRIALVIAAHRIAAKRRGMERAAEVAEHSDRLDGPAYSCCESMQADIATALRKLAGCTDD